MKNQATFTILLFSAILISLAAFYGLYLSHHFLYLLPAAIAITTAVYVTFIIFTRNSRYNYHYTSNSYTFIVVDTAEKDNVFNFTGRGYRL